MLVAAKNLPQNRSLPRTLAGSVTAAADIVPSTPFRIFKDYSLSQYVYSGSSRFESLKIDIIEILISLVN
jgi:hypothetical protein